jgi:hypothetical protein
MYNQVEIFIICFASTIWYAISLGVIILSMRNHFPRFEALFLHQNQKDEPQKTKKKTIARGLLLPLLPQIKFGHNFLGF